MKRVGCVIGAVLILLLGVGGGVAYLRGFVPDLPGLGLSQESTGETPTAIAETPPEIRAGEPGTETITIYGAICPVNYAGEDYFGDCYDTPAVGAGYTLAVGETRIPESGVAVAGSDGLIDPLDPGGAAPGTVILQAIAPNDVVGSGGFAAPAAACTSSDGRDVSLAPQDSEAGGQLFALDLLAGEDLRCDVYFVPLTAASP